MSLLDTASLIVTPNGYKEGKLYSVIPSDGSGDMSVTRATTATRVNSQGLVELVPYNLVQYSQELNNSYWSKYQGVVTANTITAPDGTLTADTLTNNLSAVASIYNPSIPNSGTNTISCYFKKGTHDYVFLELGGSAYNFCSFNIATGAIEVISGFSNVTIENEGNGWYRCYATASDSASTIFVGVGTAGSPDAGDVTYIWGFQVNEGSAIKPYQKTETRLNIPRLDYSNGTCPSLLVEPQRTNLTLYSSSLDSAAYTKAQYGTGTISVTANYGLAPDGTMSADRVQMTQGNFASELFQRPSTTPGQTYTVSFWAKSLSGTPTLYTNFNLGYFNSVTFTTEWVRYEYTYTAAPTSTATGFNLITWGNLSGTSASADLLVWGIQHEIGSYATSYIPTTNANVTRNADVISKTGISSLIGQTEGTIFWHTQKQLGENDVRLNLSDGTTNNWLFVGVEFSNYTRIYCNVGGVNQVNSYGAQLSNDFHKIAFAYKANDFVLYVDGVEVASHSSGSVPTCSRIDINAAYPTSGAFATNNNNAVALWKTRLTNEQLATLTTI